MKLPACCFFVLAVLICTSFVSIRSEPPCPVETIHRKAPFPIGVAINTDKLKNEEKYWQRAAEHFNSYTPEKVLKPMYIHPRRDAFDFWEPDHLIEFCRERRIRLHGHALLWHEAQPFWMEDFEGTAAQWDSLMKNHIQTIVRHCSSYIKSWDVVNEAFNDDGSLRDNLWKRNVGSDYLIKAYRYAAEADPSVLLFYNDYSLEKNGSKLTAVLNYLDKMKSNGITVHGIGMQMHVGLAEPSIQEINGAASRIAAEGYLVHYSELDVTLAGESTFMVSRKKLQAQQETRYREIVKGYMSLPTDKRFGITLWGVSDNDSWLTDQRLRSRPLLFDHRYRVKPAYCGFMEGLRAH